MSFLAHFLLLLNDVIAKSLTFLEIPPPPFRPL